MDISKYIDYTLLKPTTTEGEIIELCDKAKENGFYSVCISSCYVALAKQLLEDSKVKVCTVVGFPLGSMSTEAKVFEAEKAIEDGADEIDMVINLGYLKSRNHVSVLKDISDVKLAIGKTPLKVILEISELNKNEIIKACEICLDARTDFIKTSTGFSKNGATLTAVKIIKKTVRGRARIKASGGIIDLDTALKYIDAGAERIGTSVPMKSKKNSRQIRNTKIYKDYIETVLNTKSSNTKEVEKNT
ncbi:MAG: deoxyribose-phosphate aldolase [Algibacter sp.]|uniref:deoxyribose-phosphate aldolase n=1 Tax=Algibacter sp. TaxID=1872428 RepID=UPI00261AAFE3|nr:deoxyribose-phosphate aldolase [Algibacter sp.]MDG1728365.1 deoxyribose-phosphate aldolase [Algibacter sp.]MDG2178298.1 deoxyribose-phosphate aldolase [Algibacter sp.]